jgi:hypothetical protein
MTKAHPVLQAKYTKLRIVAAILSLYGADSRYQVLVAAGILSTPASKVLTAME